MFSSSTQIRVRYAETDQMGVVYYGNYATYFEVARVEALRDLNISYKGIENDGYIMPVIHFEISYKKPAHYDELITIKTTIKEIPKARIQFNYECYNDKNELLNTASTTLAFVKRGQSNSTFRYISLRETLNEQKFYFKLLAEGLYSISKVVLRSHHLTISPCRTNSN